MYIGIVISPSSHANDIFIVFRHSQWHWVAMSWRWKMLHDLSYKIILLLNQINQSNWAKFRVRPVYNSILFYLIHMDVRLYSIGFNWNFRKLTLLFYVFSFVLCIVSFGSCEHDENRFWSVSRVFQCFSMQCFLPCTWSLIYAPHQKMSFLEQ